MENENLDTATKLMHEELEPIMKQYRTGLATSDGNFMTMMVLAATNRQMNNMNFQTLSEENKKWNILFDAM